MTSANIFSTARWLTNTNTVTAPDANLLGLLTERNKQLVIRISKLRERYNETIATGNLVASQEAYALPADVLRVKRLEMLNPSSTQWSPVTFYDINESALANDSSTIGTHFNSSSPNATLIDQSIYFRPIPTTSITGGYKIWYVRRPADISSTSTVPDSPVEYHRLLADLLAIDIRQLKDEVSASQAIQTEEAIWEFLKNQVSPRVLDETMVVKPAFQNYE